MNLKDLKQKMPEIFETVKKDVRKILGRHRAGLSLGLANTSPLKIILETQPDDISWAYTYHILLHEYIHSLGIIDERRCRAITLNISEETFKDIDHPALILAKNGIGVFIPNLKIRYVPPERRPDGMAIEYVYGFDRESQSYFS